MAKDDHIKMRIDSHLKHQAELVFSRLGLNMTGAIELFLTQVTLLDGLPFEIKVPETDTEYQSLKNKLIQERLNQLQADIDTGLDDVEHGRVVDGETSRKNALKRLQGLDT